MSKFGQSKTLALIESMLNIATGLVVAFTLSQLAVELAPWVRENFWSEFKWEINFTSNLIMTILFTVISVIRGYIWRRVFNHLHIKNLQRETGNEKQETKGC